MIFYHLVTKVEKTFHKTNTQMPQKALFANFKTIFANFESLYSRILHRFHR